MDRTTPAGDVTTATRLPTDPLMRRVVAATGHRAATLSMPPVVAPRGEARAVTGAYVRDGGRLVAELAVDGGLLTIDHESGRFTGALPGEVLGTLRMNRAFALWDVSRATTRAADGTVLVDLWGEPGDGLLGTVVGHALGGLTGTGGGLARWGL